MHSTTVLLLNLPADGQVHRDMGCAYTSKSDYYYPQADLYILGAIVRPYAKLQYLDCVADSISADEMLTRVTEIKPHHIFTMVASITDKSDFANLRAIRQALPDTKIWATGDLVYYTDRAFDEIDVRVKDFTNSDAILEVFRGDRPQVDLIPISGNRRFSIGVCPHEFALKTRYHNPYSLYAPVAMMLTNWGCPFSCQFCAARNLQPESKYKHRELDEVIEEIRYIKSLGFKEIYFRDFTFAIPRTEMLVDRIIEARLKIRWSCATRIDVVNERLLRKMKAAGCYLIFFGVDGAQNDLLQQIGKDVTVEDVSAKVALTKSIGIEVLTSFIVGFPGQDLERTREYILTLDPDYLAVSILMPTYGSNIREIQHIWTGNVIAENRIDSTFSDDQRLVEFRNKLERDFYLRPHKLLRYSYLAFKGPQRIRNYLQSGLGLVQKWTLSKKRFFSSRAPKASTPVDEPVAR